jgi:arsenate reductase
MNPTLLFICLGNSCRSIMAEALARHFHGDVLEPASAGLSPLGEVVRETLKVLAEMGVATTGLRSKGLEEVDLAGCRLIVNLTDYPLEPHLPAAFQGKVLNRAVLDPYGGGLEDYRRSREAVRQLLEEVRAELKK